MQRTPKACGHSINNGRICQETYETASRDAGRRAKQLRQLGYRVAVESMGSQVTPLGLIKLTMITIFPGDHQDTFGLPEVDRVDWPRY